MKTIVIYRSLSGFSKKYAEWIAQETKADLFDAKEVHTDLLKKYDCIVFWGGLHAATINGLGLIKKNLKELHNKHFIVFATGAWPDRPNALDEVKKTNFTSEQLKQIRFFYLRWGFDFSKLPFGYKILMTIFKWMIASKKNKTPDEKGMLESYKHPTDFTKKENIKEMISYIHSLK